MKDFMSESFSQGNVLCFLLLVFVPFFFFNCLGAVGVGQLTVISCILIISLCTKDLQDLYKK